MLQLKSYFNDFLHLFFPHVCLGCGTDVLNNDEQLCIQCIMQLPETGFLSVQGNPIEKIFYGRLNIEHAGSAFYFTKDSLLQYLIVQLKYRENKNAGLCLGKMLGKFIKESNRFDDVDAIVALPLNEKRLLKRGYNQASLIVNGITEIFKKPVLENVVERTLFTETQTEKSRIERWQTMENVFSVIDETSIKNKHILLVDDIITTGATLEACGASILQTQNTKLSICTLAYTI